MREHHFHERLRRRAFGFGMGSPFEGGPAGHGGHRGRGGRGRRGNTRAAVLGLLAERPMHGYEMISELEQRTGGVWRPSPGSIYPTLQLLEDEGLIVAEETGGRRRFTLTEAGRAAAETSSENEGAPWSRFDKTAIAHMQAFREAGFGIMQAMKQIGMTGTDEQRSQAIEVLNDTKRKLYAILAQ